MHFLHLKKIDLWVLDVEGGELSVLHGTDFSKLRISVILVETMHSSAPLAVIRTKGYDCVQAGNNHVCTHETFRPSVSPQGRYEYGTLGWWTGDATRNAWVNGNAYSLSQDIVFS